MTELLKYNCCIACGKGFDNHNVFTEEGWAETQISGMCEVCFDALFANWDEEIYDHGGYFEI